MELDAAVKAAMRTVKTEDVIPEQYHGFLPRIFTCLYVAGYDQRGREFVGHRQHAITLLDVNKCVVDHYPNIKYAAYSTHYSKRTIQRSLNGGTETSRHEFWVNTDATNMFVSGHGQHAPLISNHCVPVRCYYRTGHFHDYPSIRAGAVGEGCKVLVIQRSIRLERQTRKGLTWKTIKTILSENLLGIPAEPEQTTPLL